MNRPLKILIAVVGSILGVIVVLAIALVIVVRTGWFQNYVREKIVSSVEDSTGGRVDVGSFRFEPSHMTATITGFVLHGTEPAGSAPLFEAPRIVLKLRLLESLQHPAVLEFLGVDRPATNVISSSSGRTNLPTPKKKSTSNKSGLETVVNLAIRRIEISQGSLNFLDQKMPVDVRGRDLVIALSYNPAPQHYQGRISMKPVLAESPGKPPLEAAIDVPLELGADAIQITNASIRTPGSAIQASLSVQHMSAPQVSANLLAHVALDELARSITLPIHPQPGLNALDASIALGTTDRAMRIQNASITLGSSRITASGDLRSGAEIRANLVLDQLGTLLGMKQQPAGTVALAATARVPQNAPYVLTGSLSSRDLSYGQERNMRVAANFHADPNLVAANGLRLDVLGGELSANARLEHSSTFRVNGTLANFEIRTLTRALMNKPVNYAGAIGGSLEAHGELKQPMYATAQLTITPRGAGVPVSGHLDADYNGAQDLLSLHRSQLSLPHTRVDLSGEIGHTADVRIESRNLDDFSPLADVGSMVKLKGGAGTLAIHETGPLKDAQISGRVLLTDFTVKDRKFDQLSTDVRASPSFASVDHGTVRGSGTQAQFSGSVGLSDWKLNQQAPLSANATANAGDIGTLIALAGSNLRASGPLNANIAIHGTAANPQGAAQIDAGPGKIQDEAFDRFALRADLSDRRIDLRSLDVQAGQANLQASGSYVHPRDSLETGRMQAHVASNRIDLAQFTTLERERPGLAGAVQLDASLIGELRKPAGKIEFAPSAVNANVTASDVRDRQQNYGNFTLTTATYGSEVNTRIHSNFAGSSIQITARTELKSGYPTVADANIGSLRIEKAEAVASTQPPRATGTLSAQAHFSGTLDDPHADLAFDLADANVSDEPVNRVEGRLTYTNRLASISSLKVTLPAGAIELDGSYSHAPKNFRTGTAELHLRAPGLELQRLKYLTNMNGSIRGTARLTADASVELRQQNGTQEVLPTGATFQGALDNLEMNRKALGGMKFEGHTASGTLSMNLDADLAGSKIQGNAQARLRDDYPGTAKLTLANVRYSSWEAFTGTQAPFDGLVEGEADFSGPFRRPLTGSGRVQLTRFELSAPQPSGPPIVLRNDGAIALRLNRSEIQIERAKITGPSTNLDLSGKLALNEASPLDVTLNANTDLGVLPKFIHNAYSSGTVSANANVRGTLKSPRVNGRVDLKSASIQMADWPDGIWNANGSILLNGTNARVNSITAETGGGKLTLDGFAGFTGAAFDFDLRAGAKQVRTRYDGASITADAALTLTGTSQHNVLGGTVTITRVGYNSQSDVGAILSGAATPPSAPSSSAITARTRLNIRVDTAPGVRFQTSLAEQLSASANLKVLGTLQTPGIVGRVSVTSGALVFFGNKYTVNRGSIAFYNAMAIQPVLDVDLQTSAQGVNVDLSVTGPIDNLKLSYRSDPPLKFDDIIALLATGKTPPDPTIAVNQPAAPDQTATQMGESAIVGQAIANPVANRLQRVFGITQLKISPEFVAGSTLPQARVTIQQQVSSLITFTYSQDLSQANSQLIRVELQMTPRFSAVATRDENGIFGVDFYYKKQFR